MTISDIKLDADGDGWVTVETDVLKSSASDFMVDCPPRRKGPSDYRRALVHNVDDGLTLNFAGDYPDGVTVDSRLEVHGDLQVRNGRLRLRPVDSVHAALPRTGKVGEIIVVRNADVDPARLLPDISVWLCLGPQSDGTVSGQDPGGVYWQQISVGEAVQGTQD
jgi:hypothetical protein